MIPNSTGAQRAAFQVVKAGSTPAGITKLMHSFWPTEHPPLKENEVEVTMKQFIELARLAEERASAEELLAVCPDLKMFQENKLVIRSRRSGCCF